MISWKTFTLGTLACLAAVPLRAAAPTGNPEYWNVLYFPDDDHDVRYVTGVAEDLASLLKWLHDEHPRVESIRVRYGVYDLSVPPGEADDIVNYLQAALDRSESYRNSITPPEFLRDWIKASQSDVWSLISQAWGPSSRAKNDSRVRVTSDFSEVRDKIAALERERSSGAAFWKKRPAIAALVDEELRMLRNFERLNRVYNGRVSIRLVTRPPERALETPDTRTRGYNFSTEFTRLWRLDLASMELVDGLPFLPGDACHLTPMVSVYLSADNVEEAEAKVRSAAARVKAEVDDSCDDARAVGRSVERKFLVAVPPADAKSFREEVEGLGQAVTRATYASIDAAPLESRYAALRVEVAAGPLRTVPASRGLVSAELARLRPLAEHAEKTRGRTEFEFIVRAAGPGPVAPPPVGEYQPATPPPPDLPSGSPQGSHPTSR